MRQAITRTIGEHTYEVRHLPATPAYLMFLDLSKMIAPSMAAGVASITSSGSVLQALESELDGDFLMCAIEGLVDRLDSAQVQSVVQQLAQHTALVVGDRKPELSQQFELHFAGRLGEMFRWLAFAMEVNFGDFLHGFKDRALAALRAAAAKEVSKPPTTSSGQSGDSSSSE